MSPLLLNNLNSTKKSPKLLNNSSNIQLYNKQNNKLNKLKFKEENSIFSQTPILQQFITLLLPLIFSILALILLIFVIIYLQILNFNKLNFNYLTINNKGENEENNFFDEKELKRMRRQTVPVDNVRVYATNSNVSVTERIQVLSGESRIQLIEPHLNATIWSNISLLQMDPNGREISLSATKSISLNIELFGGSHIEGIGDNLQLNESNQIINNNNNILK
ncbi:hypothetical protein Mgra_00008390 [Meloidogyne graminicola]|uniref:Uncharacterized protein n=1 Tax=Meloidogyne graminicola TaxID=189291 RepID=A0A8S9ZFW3_9BILA|nr:hypothetical protein Mgra_00008390 [Meloidogyne graminicola]